MTDPIRSIESNRGIFQLPDRVKSFDANRIDGFYVMHNISRNSFTKEDIIIQSIQFAARILAAQICQKKVAAKVLHSTANYLGFILLLEILDLVQRADQMDFLSRNEFYVQKLKSYPVQLVIFFVFILHLGLRHILFPIQRGGLVETFKNMALASKQIRRKDGLVIELMLLDNFSLKRLEHKLKGWQKRGQWLGILRTIRKWNENFFSNSGRFARGCPRDRGGFICPDVKKKIEPDGTFKVVPETRLRTFTTFKDEGGRTIACETPADLFITEANLKNYIAFIEKENALIAADSKRYEFLDFKELFDCENDLNQLMPALIEFLKSLEKKHLEESLSKITETAQSAAHFGSPSASSRIKEHSWNGIISEDGFAEKKEKVKTRAAFTQPSPEKEPERVGPIQRASQQDAYIVFLNKEAEAAIKGRELKYEQFRKKLQQLQKEMHGKASNRFSIPNDLRSLKGGVYEIKTGGEERLYLGFKKNASGQTQILVLGISETKSQQSSAVQAAQKLLSSIN